MTELRHVNFYVTCQKTYKELGTQSFCENSSVKLLIIIFCWFYLCRRARLEREAAERLAAADNKPIWRPKPKKKRRKNQKDW